MRLSTFSALRRDLEHIRFIPVSGGCSEHPFPDLPFLLVLSQNEVGGFQTFVPWFLSDSNHEKSCGEPRKSATYDQSYLTLDTASETQQKSTNPWMSWAFVLTLPNLGYLQSHSTELHQPTDGLLFTQCNLTLDNVSQTRHNYANPGHVLVGILPSPNLTPYMVS